LTKRKKRKSKKASSKKFIKPLLLSFIAVILLLGSGYLFYKLGYEKGYEKASKIAQNKIAQIKKEEKRAIQKHLKEYMSEIKDYMQNKIEKIKKVEKNIEKKIFHNKPKLAIIIGDVAFGYQVRELKSTNIPLNLSFFPPNDRHPNTPKFAKEFKFYMIHLPLEAKNFITPEPITLLTTSSEEEIENRIKKLREWFPNAKYINNHTGSKFTSDYEAMKKLIKILKKYNFRFIDSRTTPDTKVKIVDKEFGYRYLARDVFLDNEQDLKYIKNQLKKAVLIAKKRGYAIAIGHPHPKTIEALKKSKDILKDVELVYIDSLDTK